MLEKDYPYSKIDDNNLQYYDKLDRCCRCPICEKVFYVPVVRKWTYKLTNSHDKLRIMCGWTCYRKAESAIKPLINTEPKDVLKFPEDYPEDWLEVYHLWSTKAITAGEAVRLLNLEGYTTFLTLRHSYENLIFGDSTI